jgi:hypothetical protein
MPDFGLHASDPEDRPTVVDLDDHKQTLSHPSTDAERDDDVDSGSYKEPQAGIRKIEAISTAWTKWSLIIAYMS